MSISYGTLKQLVGVESLEPTIDCPSLNVVPLG